jgi:hypothetical protein
MLRTGHFGEGGYDDLRSSNTLCFDRYDIVTFSDIANAGAMLEKAMQEIRKVPTVYSSSKLKRVRPDAARAQLSQ